jgi:hypothetical protein
MAEEIKAEAVAAEVKKGVELLSVNTVVPSVYLTGQYSSSAEAKANELTVLMQKLLASGIYPSVIEAAQKGVPAGTFVIIDDPKTPAEEFAVQIVPRIFKKKGNAEAIAVAPRA